MIAPDLDIVALLGVLDDVLGMQIDEVGRDEDGRPLWRWQCIVAGHRHVSLEAWHTPAAALRTALAVRFGLLGADSPTPASARLHADADAGRRRGQRCRPGGGG